MEICINQNADKSRYTQSTFVKDAHKQHLLALNRRAAIYLLPRPQHVWLRMWFFAWNHRDLVDSTDSSALCEAISVQEESMLGVLHEFITHRAYGSQIDAIYFLRLRLIYKQPFRTCSTQNRYRFFLPVLPVDAVSVKLGVSFQINKWNRLVLVFMVCLELLLIAVVLVTVVCYCFRAKFPDFLQDATLNHWYGVRIFLCSFTDFCMNTNRWVCMMFVEHVIFQLFWSKSGKKWASPERIDIQLSANQSNSVQI